MPTIPFQATIDIGAAVYSPDGSRPWGSVSKDMPQPVTVVSDLGDKFRIGSPLWSNGKEWTTPSVNVHEYTAPAPPPTEPPAGAIPFQVSTGKPGYTAIIERNIDGVVTGRFEPNA